MRIRLLKDIETLKAGAVIYLNDDAARNWLEAGLAMEDKSLDITETKRLEVSDGIHA